jgi:hypothetical protein
MKKVLLLLCLGFIGGLFVTAEDLEVELQKAINNIASRRNRTLDVSIDTMTLGNTGESNEFSSYLYNAVKDFVDKNNMFNIVTSRGTKRQGEPENGIFTGNFFQRGNLVEINIDLISNIDGRSLGFARFTVPETELTSRGLNLVIKNEKERRELDVIIDELKDDSKKEQIQPVQVINIQAWFGSESQIYMHRDELKMTVMADQNCWFKVIHVDVNNKMKVIYPNTSDGDNYLRANSPRTIFERAKYYFYGPYGAETLMVVASTEQFRNIEQEKIAPWTAATTETIRVALRGGRGGDLETPITFSGEGQALYKITILEPHEAYEYKKPSNMAEVLQSIRSSGGVVDPSSNETSGFYIMNDVRGSYRISRDAPDTIQFASYNLRSTRNAPLTRGSSFNFSFAKPGNISQAVQTIRSGIEGKGGSFNGNEQQGNFNASGIAGQYRVSDLVNVTITEKPFIIPNSLIEKEVKNYFVGR